MKEPLIEALLFFKKGVKKMKANKILTSLVLTSLVAGTAMASSNNQSFNVGHYRSTLEANNSIVYGEDINVTQHNDGNVVRNILIGGYNNMAQHDAHNSLTVGNSNNNNSTNSVVAGDHNTITNANNSIAGGWQNASHSSNTLIFGTTNAIDFNSDNSFAGGERIKLRGKNSFVFGEGAEVEGDNTYAIGKEATVSASNSVAIGNQAKATEENSVAIGHESNTNTVIGTASVTINGTEHTFAGSAPVGTVSVGDIGKERTITNVAAGRIDSNSTDAVNGSQLHEVVDALKPIPEIEHNVDVNKKLIENHDGRINDLDNKIVDVASNTIKEANNYTDSQVASVGAQSAALAGLHPLDFNKDDKASYAASVGHYRNANAVAVGAFYRPNERTMVSGAVSFGKHIQMNLGVAFKTGKGSEYINEAKSKDSRIEKLEALVEQLTTEVAELKANK
jgi:autotransporter adhesin (fragment)